MRHGRRAHDPDALIRALRATGVLEQPRSIAEEERDGVNAHLVDEPGARILLHDVRTAGRG
jgi:hypothetical protein